MYAIGITGPSGAGKTTALRVLEAMGGQVIDCDAIYHRLLETDGELLGRIEAAFPGSVRNWQLERNALGTQVFADPAGLEKLSAITWPVVRQEVERLLTGGRRNAARASETCPFCHSERSEESVFPVTRASETSPLSHSERSEESVLLAAGPEPSLPEAETGAAGPSTSLALRSGRQTWEALRSGRQAWKRHHFGGRRNAARASETCPFCHSERSEEFVFPFTRAAETSPLSHSERSLVPSAVEGAAKLNNPSPTAPDSFRFAVIDAIGLFESGLGAQCDLTVAVVADPEIRVRRLMARDGITEEYARSRVAAQKPASWFAERADLVLENNGDQDSFVQTCQRMFGQWLLEKSESI